MLPVPAKYSPLAGLCIVALIVDSVANGVRAAKEFRIGGLRHLPGPWQYKRDSREDAEDS